jgi:putative ABC transport system ATP-binding protein
MIKQPEIAIHCSDVSKWFGAGEGRVMALNHIALDVMKGELLLLVGPSGCGKTTLISVLAGILTPDAGNYTVLGQNIQSLSARQKLDFRARNIGFVFQSYNLLPSLTLAENVAIPCIINGMDRHEAVEKAKKLLAELGLQGRENAMPSQLSGGQQQRVAIARALIHDPAIVVCDEPTSALDHSTGQHIMQLLAEINQKRGTTMVIVTHDNRIFRYAHRIAEMDDGKIERMLDAEAIHAHISA